VSEAVWEQWKEMFPETWKTNAEQKRKFKDLMRRNMEGKPNEKQQEISEHIQEFMIEMIWENCAPEDVRTNVELRQQFENLMRKSGKKSSDGERKQETDDGIRKIGGDKMLEAMKAWEAKKKASEAKEGQADTQETVEAREAKSKAFMEAQGQIQRGLTFANQLPASADMHYAGKGVVLGAVDTPIFWYKPTGSEKYHVIYADLSVKEMSPDEAGNLAEAKPEQ
jgi:myo-inositol-1-phosphate synthase